MNKQQDSKYRGQYATPPAGAKEGDTYFNTTEGSTYSLVRVSAGSSLEFLLPSYNPSQLLNKGLSVWYSGQARTSQLDVPLSTPPATGPYRKEVVDYAYFWSATGAIRQRYTTAEFSGTGPWTVSNSLVTASTVVDFMMSHIPNGYIECKTSDGEIEFSSSTDEVDLSFTYAIIA